MKQEDKLKKELISKIKRLHKLANVVWDDICETQEEYDKEMPPPDETDLVMKVEVEHVTDEDIKTWEEERRRQVVIPFGGKNKKLVEEFVELQKDIFRLLVDCKYYPLMGVSTEELALFHKETPILDAKVRDLRPSLELLGYHINNLLATKHNEMLKRYDSLDPVIFDVHIDSNTLYFYKQVLNCYIFGMFEACCVLARSVIEDIAKRFIKTKGFRELLSGADRNKKTKSLVKILLEDLGLERELVKTYRQIEGKANAILHQEKFAKETDALESVKLLQRFIQKFPKAV